MSDQYIEVAELAEIPDPGRKLVEVADRLVVVFHVDGEVSCIDDVCTHDGGTLARASWTITRLPAHGTEPNLT